MAAWSGLAAGHEETSRMEKVRGPAMKRKRQVH
jgi:hypothetical protein